MRFPFQHFLAFGVLLIGCCDFFYGAQRFVGSFFPGPNALFATETAILPNLGFSSVTLFLFHTLDGIEMLFGLFLILRFRVITFWLLRTVPQAVRHPLRSDDPRTIVPPLCGLLGLWLLGMAAAYLPGACWMNVIAIDLPWDVVQKLTADFWGNAPTFLTERLQLLFNFSAGLLLLLLPEPISRWVVGRLQQTVTGEERRLMREDGDES